MFDAQDCISTMKTWVQGKYERYPRIRMRISIAHKGRRKVRITGRKNMTRFLNQIQPYVVAKKEQVRLGLDFCKAMSGGIPLDKCQHGTREIVHQRMRLLREK